MATYTIEELKQAVHNVAPNVSNAAIALAVAISLTENPTMEATKNSPPNRDGSIDRGPFQINSRAHPEVSDACAHSLPCAAAAAFKISRGFKDFHPWTTFTSGAYKRNWARAVKAVPGAASDATKGAGVLGTGVGPDVAPGAADAAAGAIGSALSVPGQFLKLIADPRTWLRLVEMVLGVALLLMGLRSFTGGAIDPVGLAARTAAKVA